jgi:hypothetical protein
VRRFHRGHFVVNLRTQTGGSARRDVFRAGGKRRPRPVTLSKLNLPPHVDCPAKPRGED